MWSGAPFAQVLADKLGHLSSGGPGSHGSAGYGPGPNPVVLPFYIADTGSNRSIPPGRVAGAYGLPQRPRPAGPPSPSPIPKARRVLTPRQQEALGRLVDLGAQLGADYSEHELRRAFRHLARNYHPDSHPGCTEFDRARLSRTFAALHEAYRLLLPVRPLTPQPAA